MAALPSNSRIQAIHDVGVKIDDALERAQLDTARREGAHEAYANVVSSFSALLDEIDAGSESVESEAVKQWLNKLLSICQNMVNHAEAQVHTSRGAEVQTKSLVEVVKRMYDLEVEKEAQASDSYNAPLQPSADLSDHHQEIIRSAESIGGKSKLPPSPHDRPRSLKEQRQRVNVPPK